MSLKDRYVNAAGEPDIHPDDPAYEAVMKERRRCVVILDSHRRDFEAFDAKLKITGHEVVPKVGPGMVYSRVSNLVRSGRDLEDPDDAEDRLPGF